MGGGGCKVLGLEAFLWEGGKCMEKEMEEWGRTLG